MKLRSVQNSIRLRVRKSDVSALAREGTITESIHFLDGQVFAFSLTQQPGISEIAAHFENNTITVSLPAGKAKAWMESNQVGLENHQPLPNGESLHILIEKDFPCVHRDQEEIHDYYAELSDKDPENC